MKTSRFLILCVLVAVLALVVLPEVLHSYSHYQSDKRITRERARVAALLQAGDSGYDELVRLLPTLWYGNVADALNGILAQSKRDRVADLCGAYVACGNNHHSKTAIAHVLGNLGDSRAATVLLKDLESVWSALTLIQYDSQIEVLGELKAKEAADLLLRILRHQYSWEGSAWKIKENILVALGEIGDQRALPDAAKNVQSGSDWYIKQGSLNYLIHINNSEAKDALLKAYRQYNEPEVALCLVQVGEMSVLPEVRLRLKDWLDKFDTGGWAKTDYWGVFYCTHALLIAEDVDALPQLRRALALLKDKNAETQRYVSEAASGYTSKVLLDKNRAEALVPELERFLERHPAAAGR